MANVCLVKDIFGDHQQRPPMKLADGQIVSTYEQHIQRCHRHFQAVLNCPESVHSFQEEEPATVHVSFEPVT